MKSFASKERSSQVKVAFTTSGNDLNAPLDSRFGRAAKFLVYNLDTNAFTVIDNQQNLNAAQGPESSRRKPWPGRERRRS